LREETLKALRFFHNRNPYAVAMGVVFATFVLIAASAVSAVAQGAMSPYQGEGDGVSAGGKWMEFHSEDKMTGAKKVRFELQANNYLQGDQDYKPRVELVCIDGKYKYSDFDAGVALGRPGYPGYAGYPGYPGYGYGPYPYGWYRPKMWVTVRVDGSHDQKGWNWMRGGTLSMDKGTVRGAIGAQVFNVEARTKSGYGIAEFSPAGLNLDEVRKSCDLTPKKPSKD
jgi:hypothetical protein